MCCIIHRPVDSKEIPVKNLESIIKINSDGWGVSYMKDGVIHTTRSLKMDKAIEFLRGLEKDNIEFLFHARYATHGDVSIENCHPYNIHNGMMFHNGKIDVQCYNKKFSDTYYFSLYVNKYRKRGRSLQWIVNKFRKRIGPSRLAFLTSSGQIIKFGEWHEIDGCFYSKKDWQWKTEAYGSSYGYGSYWEDHRSYKNTSSTYQEQSNFDKAVEHCERRWMLYTYLINELTDNELYMLATRYPKSCAEYLWSRPLI